MPNNEPKVRTRTKTRGIGKGKYNVTKTVTKQKFAPGVKYRKVERTVSGPEGQATSSKGKFKNMGMNEYGPYDKPGKVKYKNSSYTGSDYNTETSRYKEKGPDKYKYKSYEDTYNEKNPAQSYKMGRKKVSIPAHTTSTAYKTSKERMMSPTGKGTVKQKGFINKTTGDYDYNGKPLPDKVEKDSMTKTRSFKSGGSKKTKKGKK